MSVLQQLSQPISNPQVELGLLLIVQYFMEVYVYVQVVGKLVLLLPLEKWRRLDR